MRTITDLDKGKETERVGEGKMQNRDLCKAGKKSRVQRWVIERDREKQK